MRTRQEIQDAARILAEDAMHDLEDAEALLEIDLVPEELSRSHISPPGVELRDLIEDWNT